MVSGSSRSESRIVQRMNKYEEMFKKLREQVQLGLPESNTKERSVIYDLIYSSDSPDLLGEQSVPLEGKGGQEEVREPVDRDGSGFGPTKGSRCSNAPYAKTNSAPGKGVGMDDVVTADSDTTKA